MTEQDNSTLTIAPALRYNLIWAGALIGIVFCFVDILVDVMLFNEGTVRDQLLHPSAPELWMRMSFIVFSTGFGIYAFTVLQRERAARTREQEAKRMQQESAHVMRLSTMGEMASGMAHELNQPLTALISYCGTALKLARDMPCLLYTSPSPRDRTRSRMPSSA